MLQNVIMMRILNFRNSLMKVLQLFISNFGLLLILVISINAQTEKPQAINSNKIAVINYALLKDEKTGIKEIADIYKKLEIEFKPKEDELKPLYEKRQNSLKKLQELENSIEIRVTSEFINDLVKQFDDADCKFDKKLKDVRTFFDTRKLELDKETKNEITELLKLFAKEKGYAVILDSSQNNFLVEGETIDATDEFIKFYNNQTEKK